MSKKLVQLLHTPLERRQALKVMGGTVAGMTLAACGVAPGPEPTPDLMSNVVVLRGLTNDLTGNERERLRAVAAFLAPQDVHNIDILGQYWLKHKLVTPGAPEADFIGDGIDMLIIARGESSAAVRQWARQWEHIVDIDSDEAEVMATCCDDQPLADPLPTFFVFERVAGTVALEQIMAVPSPQIYVTAHHTLINDQSRRLMVVSAPSGEVVSTWVRQWDSRRSVQIVELTDLRSKLKGLQPSTINVPAAATLVPAVLDTPEVSRLPYSPAGYIQRVDPKLGTSYFNHRGTGRFLSVDSSGKVVTVATPSPLDRWHFTKGEGLDTGNYYLQHEGTKRFLYNDAQGDVVSSMSPQTWVSGMTNNPTYRPRTNDSDLGGYLSADSKGTLFMDNRGYPASGQDTPTSAHWHQWTSYAHPSAIEQALDDLVNTTVHDAPWPEDSYTGDMKKAYDLIIQSLHDGGFSPPKEGKPGPSGLDTVRGNKITPYPAVGSELYAAAEEVMEQLQLEVDYLGTLDKWLGDSGLVTNFLRDVTSTNAKALNAITLLPNLSGAGDVKFGLAALFTFMSSAVAALEGGPIIGSFIAGAWRLYSASGGAGTLQTTFSQMMTDLESTFKTTLAYCETTQGAIMGNWGKLQAFQNMTLDGGPLIWPAPTELPGILNAANVQYEITVWQSIANAVWRVDANSVYEGSDVPFDGYPNDAFDYAVWVPVQYKYCNKIYSGTASQMTMLMDHYQDYHLAKRLFDASENLGVDPVDFFVGRNGWTTPGSY